MNKPAPRADLPRFEMISVAALKPYANNARTHSPEQIDKLRASIREFGFVNPCLIDADHGIIAGHGRVEAAKLEGIAAVPCIYVEHLTPAQKRAYILADNRLAEMAGWDESMLKIELAALDAAGFDVDLLGFELDLGDIPEISNEVSSNTTKDGQYDKTKMPVNIGALLFFLSREEQHLSGDNFDVFYADGINDNNDVIELCKRRVSELADEIRDLI